MKRYSIIVREQGGIRDVELIQVDNNPQVIVDGLNKKLLPGPVRIPKYSWIRVVDNKQTA